MKILNYSVKKCIIFLIFIIIGYFIERLLSNKYNYFSLNDKESNDTCEKSCYGLTYSDKDHNGSNVCEFNECSEINKYTSIENFGCSDDPNLFSSLGDCCNTQICDPPLCHNDLLFYNGNCYSLLDGNDNLTSLDVFFGKYILCEINHINESGTSISKDYIEYTETGDFNDIKEFLKDPLQPFDNVTSNIVLGTVFYYIEYFLGIDSGANVNEPIPKLLTSKNNHNILFFGYTPINNGKGTKYKLYDERILYMGGGMMHNTDNTSIAFYDDFVFNNIKYQNATFENNKQGYKGYKIDIDDEEKLKKIQEDDFIEKNPADVIIKFYKKSETVPTGIEPVT